ncbi:hypothetical protein CH63R_06387 [Colletotrichum higginsianum IMI 349063]|uniref:Uncharacterized protein n=1 Tax=Colletotrichum higginsianum (strain IMI 349063) TaxID=759273 RepID=A0A1B7YFC6_COLHI|nr:hypothetical protein CH63R_06387 [Colletotrichum higginsianum IMI 349063]OBR10695.1 hypothetical protein CH63R_06387 [Colletotrichum higginsianum IMI 349063]
MVPPEVGSFKCGKHRVAKQQNNIVDVGQDMGGLARLSGPPITLPGLKPRLPTSASRLVGSDADEHLQTVAGLLRHETLAECVCTLRFCQYHMYQDERREWLNGT